MSDNVNDLESQSADLHHVILTDGTSTLAQILHVDDKDEERVLAEGTAKRHRGDRRNADLGVALAMGRAYAELSKKYMRLADELGAG
ncbi:dsRBD fold-containing protein [Streptomyces sp. NPDC002754]